MKLHWNWGECSCSCSCNCSQPGSHLAMVLCLLPIALSLFVYMLMTCFISVVFRDGLGSLLAQCQHTQNAALEAADAKAKNGSQVTLVNRTSSISIPNLPLRTSEDKR